MAEGTTAKNFLYLEGVQVPFIQAQILIPKNSPVQVSITLAPLPVARDILPKTRVLMTSLSQFNKTGKPEIMFEGEVTGVGHSSTVETGGVAITAASYDTNWTEVLKYYIDLSSTPPEYAVEKIRVAGESGQAPTPIFGAVVSKNSPFDSVLQKNKDDYSASFKEIISSVATGYYLYDQIEKKVKIKDRIYAGSNKDLSKTLPNDIFKDYLKQVNAGDATESLYQILLRIAFKLKYQMISLPNAARTKMKNFVFLPDTYMLPPPRCNVIFPNMYRSFSMSRNYKAEPTRSKYYTQSMLDIYLGNTVPFSMTYYYPNDILKTVQKEVKAGFLGEDGNFDNKRQRDSHEVFMTKEEKIRGIVHGQSLVAKEDKFINNSKSLEKRDVVDDDGKKTGEKEKDSYASNYYHHELSYSFFKQKYESRAISVDIMDNENMVVGMPVLILDGSGARAHVIALLEQIVYNITPSNSATSISLSTPRYVDELDLNDENLKFNTSTGRLESSRMKEPSLPGFLNDRWGSNPGITLNGGTTKQNTFSKLKDEYNSFLGEKGGDPITSWPSERSTDPDYQSIPKAVSRIFDEYSREKKNNSQAQWVRNFVKRDIATIKELKDFLGLTVYGDEYTPESYVGKGDYNGTSTEDSDIIKLRRSVVKEFVRQLKTYRGIRD